jgi:hypothetical protein
LPTVVGRVGHQSDRLVESRQVWRDTERLGYGGTRRPGQGEHDTDPEPRSHAVPLTHLAGLGRWCGVHRMDQRLRDRTGGQDETFGEWARLWMSTADRARDTEQDDVPGLR